MHIHLDALGGVAGDMFIAAMLDAFPDLANAMLAAIRDAGLPSAIALRTEAHADGVLTGKRFIVDEPGAQPHDHDHHHHTPFARIGEMLRASASPPNVRERAIAIFTLLAEVEGKIHGVPPQSVSFHELGGWDSIADMVGAAYLIDAVQARSWSVSELPLGSGTVMTAHGRLPVPSPATALLLEGYTFRDDGVGGERITPTGAAILRHLGCEQGLARPRGKLVASGYGFGTRKLPGMSNVLRLLRFDDAPQSVQGDEAVAVIEFEVDDQTPEDLALGLQHVRETAGVLDVIQSPAFGKKGRMLAQIRVLAQPDARAAAIEACFAQTTTLGLRYGVMQRKVLVRREQTVREGEQTVRVKIAQRPDRSATAKAESDDIARAADTHVEREALARAAERAVGERERK
jgi:pyridinium-3,5-bisthiocarboxylic acid mononucleotide nickel chelatase